MSRLGSYDCRATMANRHTVTTRATLRSATSQWGASSCNRAPSSSFTTAARRPTPPINVLPTVRLMDTALQVLSTGTTAVCIAFHRSLVWLYANAVYTVCSSRAPDQARSGQTGCNVACPSPNGAQTCGGANRIQVFTNDQPYPYKQPRSTGLQSGWSYQGCYTYVLLARLI
jgi:hypothetical protein